MEELIEPGVNGALWRGDPTSLGRGRRAVEQPERLQQGEQAEATETHLLARALPG